MPTASAVAAAAVTAKITAMDAVNPGSGAAGSAAGVAPPGVIVPVLGGGAPAAGSSPGSLSQPGVVIPQLGAGSAASPSTYPTSQPAATGALPPPGQSPA